MKTTGPNIAMTEPEASDREESNKVLVTQSPFKFECAVHNLASYCKNDIRSQLTQYITEQRRMSSTASAYLYLTVTPEGEMKFTNHADGQLYLQDVGEFTRDVKRMLTAKAPKVPPAPIVPVIPVVTMVEGKEYKTIRLLNDGYYIGECETDELGYKDISVAEAIVYALNSDRGRRLNTLRVDRGDGQWKHYPDLQQLFKKATTSKYQQAEKKVIRRVMHVSSEMAGKIRSCLWDEIKDSKLRVSDTSSCSSEHRYWTAPGGFFVRDCIGTSLRGLRLFVEQS